MRELLPKQTQDYIERARHVAETSVRPVAAELDRSGDYPWSVIEALREADLMGIWIPEEYGGQSAGVLDLCVVVEELSRACGGVGVAYAVNALGSFPIIVGGTDEQKEKWLPLVASGEKLIAFGLSEKVSGSDAGSLTHPGRSDGDDYVINGDKKWNTNGNAASIYTVYASTRPDRGHRGISAIMVEKGTPGFEIGKREDLMGIRCVPVHELHFRDCRVPAENLLGDEGKGFAQRDDDARPGASRRRRPGRRAGAGGARLGDPLHLRAAAVRPVGPVLPGDPVQGRRPGHGDRGRAADGLHGGARHRRRVCPTPRSSRPCARSSPPTWR